MTLDNHGNVSYECKKKTTNKKNKYLTVMLVEYLLDAKSEVAIDHAHLKIHINFSYSRNLTAHHSTICHVPIENLTHLSSFLLFL